MIKNNYQLSMAEVAGYSKEKTEKTENPETDIKEFIKKFIDLSPKDAKELRKKLESLELMKLKNEQAVKIIDLMPENDADLNKIFIDVSLDEDETKKILETVKEFK